jgi:hypothetical protein
MPNADIQHYSPIIHPTKCFAYSSIACKIMGRSPITIMNSSKIIIAFLAIVASVIAVSAQTTTFSDPNADYKFEIPDAKWKLTVKPSATNRNAEMVFVDRNDGHLEIRKVSSPAKTSIADVIREEEIKLQFNPGYVAGKDENFAGKLAGGVFNYEYVKAGRPMAGRFYFLRSGDAVYVLRFTGFRDKLRSIRNQTDIMARTFEPVPVS